MNSLGEVGEEGVKREGLWREETIKTTRERGRSCTKGSCKADEDWREALKGLGEEVEAS